MTLARLLFLLALSLGGVSILLSSFATPAQSRKKRAAKRSAVVREIDAEALKDLLRRGSITGRPLLVNFWATWCDPCREEFPDLVKIDKQYRAKGLDFIAVSLDDRQDIKTAVPKFLRQMRATMPAYLLSVKDPEPAINAVDPAWGGALPATFLYDAEGNVAYKNFGRIKDFELRAAVEKLVGIKK
jgi:thiol-disulfide isomerase/thioredoxin